MRDRSVVHPGSLAWGCAGVVALPPGDPPHPRDAFAVLGRLVCRHYSVFMNSRSVPAALVAALALVAACGRAWYDPIDQGGGGAGDAGDPSGTGDAAGGDGDRDAGLLITRGAAADTYLSASQPGANFGALDLVRTADSPAATILLRFDLGDVPAGAVPQAVTLALSTSDAAQDASRVRIYRVFEDWTEGGESGAPGVASWDLRAPGQAWTSPGCGVGSRDAAARAEVAIDAPATRYQVELPTSVVEGWIADPASNLGLALIATSGSGVELVSSDGDDPGERPGLAIEWAR